MEIADSDICTLRGFKRLPTFRFNADMSSEAEREQRDDTEAGTQHEPNQETPDLRSGPLSLDVIKSRIRWLHNRRFLLLKMLQLTEEAEQHGGGGTEERTDTMTAAVVRGEDKPMTGDGTDRLCELEAIQKELEELQVKKEELEELQVKKEELEELPAKKKEFKKPKVDRGHQKGETLPHLQRTQDYIPLEQRVKTGAAAERPTGSVVPVDSLGRAAAVTKCPSCQEVTITETHSTVSETMWLSCCLCATFGCVAGCCLIPFCMKSLRSVHHRCPRCQEHIHTHHPL